MSKKRKPIPASQPHPEENSPRKKRSAPADSRRSGGHIHGDNITGDKIEVGDVGERSQVAIGERITQIGTLVLHTAQANPKPVMGLLVVILLAVGAVLFLQIQAQAQPRQMSGTFNIAVAAFDAQGPGVDRQAGVNVANWLEEQLRAQQASYPAGSVVEIWGPDLTGRVSGSGADELDRRAESLARQIKANILVYGTITAGSGSLQITPRFYVQDVNFSFAQEMTGPHRLGSPLVLPAGALENAILNARLNQQLHVRATALSNFTIGLTHFFLREYDQALAVFSAIEALEAWKPEQGKEVLYLFLGNTELNRQNYPQAHVWFQQATRLNQDYSRAYIGEGLTYFQEAVAPLAAAEPHIEEGLLDQSIGLFERGLNAADRPASADVEWKARFGFGRAFLIKGQYVDKIHFERAEQELRQVISAHEAGQVRLTELSAQAYANLGLLYYLTGREDQAVEMLTQALEIGQINQYKANWAQLLSRVYTAQGSTQQAEDFAAQAKQYQQQADLENASE